MKFNVLNQKVKTVGYTNKKNALENVSLKITYNLLNYIHLYAIWFKEIDCFPCPLTNLARFIKARIYPLACIMMI